VAAALVVAAVVMAFVAAASGAAPGAGFGSALGRAPVGAAPAVTTAVPVLLSGRAVRSRLQPLSSTPVNAVIDAAGAVRWLSGSFGSDLERGGASALPEAAYRFLEQNRAVLGIAAPRAEFVAPRVVKDRFGARHVYFSQRLNGVAVLNGGVAVHFDRFGRITVVDGGYVPSAAAPDVSSRAEIPAQSAVLTAVQRVRRTPDGLAGGATARLGGGAPAASTRTGARFPYGQSTLTLAARQLGYWSAPDGSAHLVWQLRLDADRPEAEWVVTVDAHSGRVLAAANDLRTSSYGAKASRGRDLFNKTVTLHVYRDPAGGRLKLVDTSKLMRRRHSTNHPYSKWQGAIEVRTAGSRVDSSGDAVESAKFPTVFKPAGGSLFTDRAAVSLARDFSLTYDTYLAVFGRNSLNGRGISVIGNVHLGRKYDNAYWSPEKKMMFFGDNLNTATARPFPRAVDVVAHEFTHGVTNYSVRQNGRPHGFTYSGQSGAIDEGYSDVFACVVDWDDWTMGEDLGGSSMRSLQDPSAFDQPVSMFDYYSMPEEMDNGGVHYDNSLISYADYLIATQLNAGGMAARDARDAAGRVYYQAYRYLDGYPDASLQLAALALVRAAGDIDVARGDGQTTMQQLVTAQLTKVGILQGTVVQYDDGSVVASDDSINSWRFNDPAQGVHPTRKAAVQFARPGPGDVMTVQVGLWNSASEPQIPDAYQVWLAPADQSGQPVGEPSQWLPVYPGVTATPRYDGVFTNFRLPSPQAARVADTFCVVVGYTNTVGQPQYPELLADTASAGASHSWMEASEDGGLTYGWYTTTDLFGSPYNWMIRVVWDQTAP
jgi:bacillolysin